MAKILPTELADHDHDHGACVSAALSVADETARAAGRPLKGLRRDVLTELLRAHALKGAYELRDALAVNGRRLQPVQIYRALDALMALGLVHRVESRNAFMACTHGRGCAAPQLVICESCDRVAEIGDEALGAVLDVVAQRTGFAIAHSQVEMSGRCPACQAA